MSLLPGLDYPTQIVVGPLTINDNQMVPSVLFSLAISAAPNFVVEYSIIRGTITQMGSLLVSTNGIVASQTNGSTGTNLSGVILSPNISGSNLEVQYISTSTGQAGQFWYTIRNITN